jgi:hypothetical protein
MLDLSLLSNGTVRGAAITQTGISIAMASVMFGLILHFQYAYGWTPVRAGLANLPIILTMVVATPVSEALAKRFGHRIACVVGAVLVAGSLAGLSWGVDHGYAAIAVSMVVMTVGLRTVMTICAVALVDEMLSNRTSLGLPQRHGAGGRHQHRHCCGRHAPRRAGHHPTAGGHLERGPRGVVLAWRTDHLRCARRARRPGRGRWRTRAHRFAHRGGA